MLPKHALYQTELHSDGCKLHWVSYTDHGFLGIASETMYFLTILFILFCFIKAVRVFSRKSDSLHARIIKEKNASLDTLYKSFLTWSILSIVNGAGGLLVVIFLLDELLNNHLYPYLNQTMLIYFPILIFMIIRTRSFYGHIKNKLIVTEVMES